jgi:hypothetical protein
LSKSASTTVKVLDDGDMAALFGLEMADGAVYETSSPVAEKNGRKTPRSGRDKAAAQNKTWNEKASKSARPRAAKADSVMVASVKPPSAKKRARSSKDAANKTTSGLRRTLQSAIR